MEKLVFVSVVVRTTDQGDAYIHSVNQTRAGAELVRNKLVQLHPQDSCSIILHKLRK